MSARMTTRTVLSLAVSVALAIGGVPARALAEGVEVQASHQGEQESGVVPANAIQQARENLELATQAKEQADEEALDAKQAANEASAAADVAKAVLDQKTQSWEEAKENEGVTKNAAEDASAATAAARQALSNAQTDVVAKENDIAAKKEALRQAESTVAQAQQEVANKEALVSEKETNLASVQQSVASLEAQAQKGSVGFFESMGDQVAAGFLTDQTSVEGSTNTTFASHTTIGGATDATSLRNMLDALDWIEYCNQLRVDEGLAELNVTDGMMASAQRNANFSTFTFSHAEDSNGYMNMAEYRGNSAGENLCQASAGIQNGYRMWYSNEKVVWERAVSADPSLASYKTNAYGLMMANPTLYMQVGHYLNIVNPSFTVTGLGLNTGSRGASIQQFMRAGSNAGTQYSVAAYRTRLQAYYDEYVTNVNSALNAAQEELDQARADLLTAQGALDGATAAKTSAEQALAAAEQALPIAQNDVVTKQAELSEAETSEAKAKEAYEAAKTATAGAKEEETAARAAYNEAKALFDDAQTAYAQKSEAALAAAEVLKAAQDKLDALTNLSNAEIAGVGDVVYSGVAIHPVPVVTLAGVELVVGRDYDVTYGANTNAGTGSITISAKGDYVGSKSASFKIARAQVALPKVANSTYTGKAQVGVAAGTGYVLSGTAKATVAGTYVAYATLDANHCWTDGTTSKKKLEWKISPKAVTPLVTLAKASNVYTGKAIKPAVTVKVGSDKLSTSQFSVAWPKDVTSVGSHTVTVTLKGNYSGKGTESYTIVPKSTTVSTLVPSSKAVAVTWNKQPTQTTGYQVQYSTSKTFARNNKAATISSTKTTSKTITGLQAKKTYYFRIRTYKKVGGKTYYSAWSAASSVKTK